MATALGTVIFPLNCFLMLQVNWVTSEYLTGFSQKTIKVSLSPPPYEYAAISLKTKVKVVSGMSRSNSTAVSFSASYLGYLNRWSLKLKPGSNQSSTEKTLCISEDLERKSMESNDEDFVLGEMSTPQQDKDYIYTVIYSRTVDELDVEVETDWDSKFLIGLNETIQTEVDLFSSLERCMHSINYKSFAN